MLSGKSMSNLQRTILLTAILSAAAAAISGIIQSRANTVVSSCSYLDPLAVDIAALAMSAFLIIEGITDIFVHRQYLVRRQLTRCLRVALGCSILTIHTMQFIHK